MYSSSTVHVQFMYSSNKVFVQFNSFSVLVVHYPGMGGHRLQVIHHRLRRHVRCLNPHFVGEGGYSATKSGNIRDRLQHWDGFEMLSQNLDFLLKLDDGSAFRTVICCCKIKIIQLFFVLAYSV